MPPPPAQMTMIRRSTSKEIVRAFEDLDRCRRGHDPPPMRAIQRDGPSTLARELSRRRLIVDRADRLGWMFECGVVPINADRSQQGSDDAPTEPVLQLLLDHVADHALRLGAQHVEREGTGTGVCRLQGEQAHLRPVAMGDDELVTLGDQNSQRLRRAAHIGALRHCVHRLTALEEGVAAKSCHDPHVSPRSSRRASP